MLEAVEAGGIQLAVEEVRGVEESGGGGETGGGAEDDGGAEAAATSVFLQAEAPVSRTA